MKKYTRADMAKDFANRGFTKGVEVGVRWGAFSLVLCQSIPDLELKSVDPYSLVYQDVRSHREGIKTQEKYFQRASALLAPHNCEIIRRTSLEAVADFPFESIDFVYIDGSHQFDYVMCDIIEWTKRVRKGGIVSGHDYYQFVDGDVVRAVDNYCVVHGIRKIHLTCERTPSWWFERTW
jgi:predicted O-methyltransferase YrrM